VIKDCIEKVSGLSYGLYFSFFSHFNPLISDGIDKKTARMEVGFIRHNTLSSRPIQPCCIRFCAMFHTGESLMVKVSIKKEKFM
jgi:hypothetical protein